MTGTYDARYEQRRTRAIAAGTWQHPVAGAVVAAHIQTCRDAGMSIADLARVALLPYSTVYAVSGRKYVEGATAAAVLAVHPRPSLPAGMASGVTAARRLQALIAVGHPMTVLAGRLGWHLNHVWGLTHGGRPVITEANFKAVDRLYEELCATPGPSVRARRMAERYGWLPPLAWDDIDDPGERPSVYARGEECVNGHDLDRYRRVGAGGRVACRVCESAARKRRPGGRRAAA